MLKQQVSISIQQQQHCFFSDLDFLVRVTASSCLEREAQQKKNSPSFNCLFVLTGTRVLCDSGAVVLFCCWHKPAPACQARNDQQTAADGRIATSCRSRVALAPHTSPPLTKSTNQHMHTSKPPTNPLSCVTHARQAETSSRHCVKTRASEREGLFLLPLFSPQQTHPPHYHHHQ